MKPIFVIISILTVATAAPLIPRDCTAGLFNCLDGKTYQQCVPGGTWSVIMPVAPGTTCKTGISVNPWLDSAAAVAPSSPVVTVSVVPVSASSYAPNGTPAPTSAYPAPSSTQVSQSQAPSVISSSIASSLPTSVPTATPGQNTTAGGYTGNGRFKPISQWVTFDQILAKTPIGKCSPDWNVTDNSPEETQQVINAIKTLAGDIDPRFILSIVIQESSGCVRVPTTNNGVRNPGLMQDANGPHTCNEGGKVQNPCPVEEINGMISDGLTGGDNNYVKNMKTAAQAGAVDSFAYAVAARIFNSGSFNIQDLDAGYTADNQYVTKVMGRLDG